jgi:putative component of membrane protein insertase Oxa1/YidC/SpoIIIJ protein YidD
MRPLALALIRLYQRHLSPHKGYRCAYAGAGGRGSCSTLGYRAIRRLGVIRGLSVLRMRFARCAVAARELAALRITRAAAQSGHCDLLLGAECLPSAADALAAVDCAACCIDAGHGGHAATAATRRSGSGRARPSQKP